MNPDYVKPIAAEAHRLGLHVSGHVPAFMTSERAINDGYDEINHINQLLLMLLIDVTKEDTRTPFRFTAIGERMASLDLTSAPVRALLKLVKDKKITLDPTMATFAPVLLARPGKASFSEDNGRVLATEVFEVHNPVVPVERLKDWKALENAAGRAARTKIVLIRGN
jgi:hypothetical protein